MIQVEVLFYMYGQTHPSSYNLLPNDNMDK